jgi:hypothetical protein
VLAAARRVLSGNDNVTYPSQVSARHLRGVVRRLADLLEHGSAEEFVELPKSRMFSPEEAAARLRWAMEFVPKFAGAARGLGYGVFHGGTLVRDIDLVAVPWQQPTAKPADLFVVDMVHALNLQMGNRGDTIYGHRWYALWDRGHRDHQIDLKVVLPANGVQLSDGGRWPTEPDER